MILTNVFLLVRTALRRNILVAVWLLTMTRAIAPANCDEPPVKSDATFRVVGYLPDYRVEQIDPAVGSQLTDLVFFSVMPAPDGRFTSKAIDSPKTTALLNRFREQQVKIQLCVGGWDRSKGFAEIAASLASRQRFAQGLTDYCVEHGFSGADLDWEHPKNAIESTNYGLLLAEISRSFKPHQFRLTMAIAAWQALTPEAIAAVDAIHLMSYDADGKHSTLDSAKADVQRLLDAGVPSRKICLGLPFYGRGITQRAHVKTYAEIIAANPGLADKDEADGMYFNGPSTIRTKIQFAKTNNLGGVMIWEIGQDAPGDASLLKVIAGAVK